MAEVVPVVCAALLLDDGGRELLAARQPVRTAASARWPRLLPAAVVLAVMALPFISQSRSWKTRYDHGSALGLAGATSVRSDDLVATELHQIVGQLSSCDQIVSYPGFNSFYMFTGTDPPTGFNTTFPDALLTDDEQREIVETLDDTSGTICYFHIRGFDPLPPADGPLVTYLDGFGETLAEGQSWLIYVREQA